MVVFVVVFAALRVWLVVFVAAFAALRCLWFSLVSSSRVLFELIPRARCWSSYHRPVLSHAISVCLHDLKMADNGAETGAPDVAAAASQLEAANAEGGGTPEMGAEIELR